MAVEAHRSLTEGLLDPLFGSLYFVVASAGVARALQVHLVQLGDFQQSLADSGRNRGTVALNINNIFKPIKIPKQQHFSSSILPLTSPSTNVILIELSATVAKPLQEGALRKELPTLALLLAPILARFNIMWPSKRVANEQ